MYRVILVDDEFWSLKGLEALFPWAAHGFEIIGCYDDSEQALEMILRQKPEVVVTDIRMPELNGLELLGAVRDQGLNCEFVIISGYGEFDYAREALRLGAFDYLLKPVAFEEAQALLGRLAAHLSGDVEGGQAQGMVSANAQFNALIQYVRDHYHEPLQLKTLSQQFYINPTYCSELFNKAMGVSFSKFVNQLRLDHCCALLRTTPLSIEEVARQAGYGDYTHFHKVFKSTLGVSPLQYRRQGNVP